MLTFLMSKKHLSLALRFVVAAAGLAYIALALTWSDQVAIPAGTTLPDGRTLAEPTVFKVVNERLAVATDNAPLEVVVSHDGKRFKMNVPRGQFQPGISSTLRSANIALLFLGLSVVGPVYLIQSARWWLLMWARGLVVTWWKSFRLFMVGCFFNYCMPGTTGGDVLKAYYAAKNSHRRADAVMSVVFDRITGAVGLMLLGGIAGLFMLSDPRARHVTIAIWALAGMITVAALIYFTPQLRRATGLNWLLGRVPGRVVRNFLESIDNAAVAYGDHKRHVATAILISIVAHVCLIMGTALGGYALGIRHPPGFMLTVLPVLFFGGALPISYQGLGIMEGLGMPLLVGDGMCTKNQLIGMLMIFRLYMITYSMSGSLFLMRGDIHIHAQETASTPGFRA